MIFLLCFLHKQQSWIPVNSTPSEGVLNLFLLFHSYCSGSGPQHFFHELRLMGFFIPIHPHLCYLSYIYHKQMSMQRAPWTAYSTLSFTQGAWRCFKAHTWMSECKNIAKDLLQHWSGSKLGDQRKIEKWYSLGHLVSGKKLYTALQFLRALCIVAKSNNLHS